MARQGTALISLELTGADWSRKGKARQCEDKAMRSKHLTSTAEELHSSAQLGSAMQWHRTDTQSKVRYAGHRISTDNISADKE